MELDANINYIELHRNMQLHRQYTENKLETDALGADHECVSDVRRSVPCVRAADGGLLMHKLRLNDYLKSLCRSL